MKKIKPSRWYYVLAILFPVFACVGTATIVYRIVPKLPGALEKLDIKNLMQVVVPGSEDIHFPETGAYAVYYEYRSVVDGVRYYGNEYSLNISCQLRSKSTGESVELDYSVVEGDVYTYPERAGVMFKRISIDQPGVYDFSCQYPDGGTYPKSVLAVGPNILREFFSGVAKPVAAIICGGLGFVLACGISMLIIGIVVFKRHQSQKALASHA